MKEYRTKKRETVLALDHVNLEVADQEFVCLVGSSGCGKSTLLNIVAGLDMPTSGTVEIDHEPIIGPGPDRGMVFQTYSLYPWRTVAENVAFGLECLHLRKARAARARCRSCSASWASPSSPTTRPTSCRGACASGSPSRAHSRPSPTSSCSTSRSVRSTRRPDASMQDFLLTVWKRTQSTVLFVTHDIPEAIYLGSRVVVLAPHPGRVIADIDVPFGAGQSVNITRDPRFLDLRDEIEDMLGTV